MANTTISYCPTCGQKIDYNITTSTESVGTCDHCSLTLSVSEWQRYASDPVFRASYASIIANAVVLRENYSAPSNLHYAVIESTTAGQIERSIVEYEYEQEIIHEIKLLTRAGASCVLLADGLTQQQAHEMGAA